MTNQGNAATETLAGVGVLTLTVLPLAAGIYVLHKYIVPFMRNGISIPPYWNGVFDVLVFIFALVSLIVTITVPRRRL